MWWIILIDMKDLPCFGAQQARTHNTFKNIKLKFLQTCCNMAQQNVQNETLNTQIYPHQS